LRFLRKYLRKLPGEVRKNLQGQTRTFPSFGRLAYEEMCRLDPHKPIMIAEWATGEFPLATAEPSAMRKPEWIKQGDPSREAQDQTAPPR
jgi:hypothetical protein